MLDLTNKGKEKWMERRRSKAGRKAVENNGTTARRTGLKRQRWTANK